MAIEELTAEKAQNITGDFSKKLPYEVVTAFGFNRAKDRKALAVDAGIQNYTGQVSENIKIKNMLIAKLDELKGQATTNVIKATKSDIAELKIESEKSKLYNKIINKITLQGDNITLTDKANVVITRNEETLQRSSEVVNMPLVANGKGILMKYTDPDTQTVTILAIDSVKDKTLSFREVSVDQNTVTTLTTTIYSAPMNEAKINLAQLDIIEKGGTTAHIEPKMPKLIGAEKPEILLGKRLLGNTMIVEKKDKSPEGNVFEKEKNTGLVLTEKMLQNYDNNEAYPDDPQGRSYKEVYEDTYNALKDKREGKKIDILLREGEDPIKGTITFVGGVVTVENEDGTGTRSMNPYEITANHIVLYREGGVLYTLVKDGQEGDKLLAHAEPYNQNVKPIENTGVDYANNQGKADDYLR